VEPTNQVRSLINCLTNDEDKRQELWLHYLSGNEPSTFASHLNKLDVVYSADSEIQSYLWDIFNNPPSDRFRKLLTEFSDIEQSIICLLALGLNVSQVSKYKGISEVRIRHVIDIIRYNDYWDEYFKQKSLDKQGMADSE